MAKKRRSTGWTRREAIGLLGAGAAAAAFPGRAAAQTPVFPPGAIIRSLLRDHAPAELAGGATLFHEHMSFAPDFLSRWIRFATETRAANGAAPPGDGGTARTGGPRTEPSGTFFMQDLELMADEMRIARREGVACLVDGGHPDMGRDIGFLRRLSQQSGMPIVAGGGFYTQPFYPDDIATMSEAEITRVLVRQVEEEPIGVFGEIGSWDYISAVERKVFRAIGKAHVETNVPIFTHTGIPGKSALEQLDILEDAGVAPDRVVIGHLGNLVDPDVAIHKAICRRGAFVGFDRQGGPGDAEVVPMVMALIDAGFADHLMFASDFSSATQLKRNGGGGYAKTVTVFVPKLKAAGATDAVLRGIMHDNPRRFLAHVPTVSR